MDLADVNKTELLLLVFLRKADVHPSKEELYHICVDSEVVNGFFFNSSVDNMLQTDKIYFKSDFIFLTDKGTAIAIEHKDLAPVYYLNLLLSKCNQYYELKRQTFLQ
ncbi:MAG: hypothetical protein LBL93_07435 [Ruminococcus sp.]|jgi:hypothetical protein|nr:hypothetical protein [Ruminococcus sp.]